MPNKYYYYIFIWNDQIKFCLAQTGLTRNRERWLTVDNELLFLVPVSSLLKAHACPLLNSSQNSWHCSPSLTPPGSELRMAQLKPIIPNTNVQSLSCFHNWSRLSRMQMFSHCPVSYGARSSWSSLWPLPPLPSPFLAWCSSKESWFLKSEGGVSKGETPWWLHSGASSWSETWREYLFMKMHFLTIFRLFNTRNSFETPFFPSVLARL